MSHQGIKPVTPRVTPAVTNPQPTTTRLRRRSSQSLRREPSTRAASHRVSAHACSGCRRKSRRVDGRDKKGRKSLVSTSVSEIMEGEVPKEASAMRQPLIWIAVVLMLVGAVLLVAGVGAAGLWIAVIAVGIALVAMEGYRGRQRHHHA